MAVNNTRALVIIMHEGCHTMIYDVLELRWHLQYTLHNKLVFCVIHKYKVMSGWDGVGNQVHVDNQ